MNKTRSRRMPRAAYALAGAAVVATLASCLPSSAMPEPSELTCEWVNEGDGSSMSFGMYGSLEFTDLPTNILDGDSPDASLGVFSGEGTWVYGDGRRLRDTGGWRLITVNLPGEDGSIVENWLLRVQGSGSGMSLFEWVGDPDANDRYEFTRECNSD